MDRFLFDSTFFYKNYFLNQNLFHPKFVFWWHFFHIKILFTQKFFYHYFCAQNFSEKIRFKIVDIKIQSINQNAIENGVWLWRWPNLLFVKFPVYPSIQKYAPFEFRVYWKNYETNGQLTESLGRKSQKVSSTYKHWFSHARRSKICTPPLPMSNRVM